VVARAGLALLLVGLAVAFPAGAQAPAPVADVRYRCDAGKSLSATYFDGPTRTAPDGRPVPGGRVALVLGDGRRLSLPQTMSGSGIRYATPDESLVFWSKGETAFVQEGPASAETYANCVAVRP
jgi:membrane-bound inhibitor of C-type lysozyme